MSKIETNLTTILIIVFLTLLASSVMNRNAEKIAAQELAEKKVLEKERQLLIDARSLGVTVEHDQDPNTKTIAVVLSASSSYDAEKDSMLYSWKQIFGNDANINESSEASVFNFDAPAGNYGFELTITDNYGASCVDTHWVNIAPEPNSCPKVIIEAKEN